MILTAGKAAIVGPFAGEAAVVEAGFELRGLHGTTQPAPDSTRTLYIDHH